MDSAAARPRVCFLPGYWNGTLVAVKVLEQVAGDFNPRSTLEPLLHHRLCHPNIVAMFDVCTQVTWGWPGFKDPKHSSNLSLIPRPTEIVASLAVSTTQLFVNLASVGSPF